MRVYWIWLAEKSALHPSEKLAVIERFGPEDLYYAQRRALEAMGFLRPEAVEALLDKDLQTARGILAQCRKANVQVLTWQDAQYPRRLRTISDPPLVLYYKGILPEFEEAPAIGVVGTRKASAYGQRTAKRLGFQIACCGGLVVSGMAAGIDARATEGALAAGKPAVGVLGCGADVMFPKENRELFARMERQGCLISEFPPGTPPYKWNFPKRNRIISGMSCGVLVVEAPKKSGALITAAQAMEQGRDVFTVPGNVDVASCAGSNELLREGAAMAGCGWDVVGEYAARYPDTVRHDTTPEPWLQRESPQLKVAQPVQKIPTLPTCDKKDIDNGGDPPYIDGDNTLPDLTGDEQRVLDVLGQSEMHIDDMIAGTGLSAGGILAALTLLQMKGLAVLLPGGRARRESK